MPHILFLREVFPWTGTHPLGLALLFSKLWGATCLHIPALDYICASQCLAFYVLRTRPQVPMLMQQVLLHQSHVPSLLYTAKDVGSVGHVPPEPGDLLWVLLFLPSSATRLRWGSSHFLGRLGLFNVVYSSPSKPLHGPVEPSFFQWVAFCCQPL